MSRINLFKTGLDAAATTEANVGDTKTETNEIPEIDTNTGTTFLLLRTFLVKSGGYNSDHCPGGIPSS